MRLIDHAVKGCQSLYRQWVASGGFCASGMFMEGHHCLQPLSTEKHEEINR